MKSDNNKLGFFQVQNSVNDERKIAVTERKKEKEKGNSIIALNKKKKILSIIDGSINKK